MHRLELTAMKCFSGDGMDLHLIGYKYFVASGHQQYVIYETMGLEEATDYSFHTEVARKLYHEFIERLKENNKKNLKCKD